MNKKSWMELIAWIITFEAIGFFLGMLTQANIPSSLSQHRIAI
ncbi:hypothetical protein [Legionella pneumophila]|nr:hypothetical protein [Legionella pneumophila]ABQ54281.1 hypothetical protein LPC_0286 [Legionella pneumophila str. Corby]MCW8435170.1 hypothetical protein [Legionella pneumophila]MCW8466176.1 hypothetical protein [Legionella pneumophila]MCW8475810.1 hypothetical protein [Legionella pneumophila]MCZ4682292.1 hypothetical protein [Legionella pneumophila]